MEVCQNLYTDLMPVGQHRFETEHIFLRIHRVPLVTLNEPCTQAKMELFADKRKCVWTSCLPLPLCEVKLRTHHKVFKL